MTKLGTDIDRKTVEVGLGGNEGIKSASKGRGHFSKVTIGTLDTREESRVTRFSVALQENMDIDTISMGLNLIIEIGLAGVSKVHDPILVKDGAIEGLDPRAGINMNTIMRLILCPKHDYHHLSSGERR